MKIIYNSVNDVKEFDFERYYNSLNRYGKVSREDIEKELSELHYEPMHYSVLVELGVKLLPTELTAKEYWEDHKKNGGVGFERLRRITGYLVGSLERWNDSKRAEERERVKHNVNGVYTTKQKAEREVVKKEEMLGMQDEYRKGTCYD